VPACSDGRPIPAVDHALGSIELAADDRAALVLLGETDVHFSAR
jgi:hypothetical protein